MERRADQQESIRRRRTTRAVEQASLAGTSSHARAAAASLERTKKPGRPITAAAKKPPRAVAPFARLSFRRLSITSRLCAGRKRNQNRLLLPANHWSIHTTPAPPTGAAGAAKRKRKRKKRIPGRRKMTSRTIYGHSRRRARHWALSTSGAPLWTNGRPLCSVATIYGNLVLRFERR